MRRLAAALPFTSRPPDFFLAGVARRVARRVGARRAARFFRFLRVVFLRNSACTATDCCAKPWNPPGGTNALPFAIIIFLLV